MMTERQAHPVADVFPIMRAEAYDSLRADIAANGLREPIWLHRDGRIIDGRNRYRACMATGTEPTFRTFDGPDDALLPLALSLNLQRRHLSSSQRAAAALGVERYEAVAAKERLSLAGIQHGRGQKPVVILPQAIDAGKARDKAAEALGVSPSYVSQAKRIAADAPELISLVESGDLTIPDAKKLSRLEPEHRTEVVRRVTSGESRDIKQAKRSIQAEAKAYAPVDAAALPEACHLFVGDVAEAGQVDAGSVDCIITDPPYPREFVTCYADLARFAEHALKDGGSLIAMAGQSYLPDVLDAMREAGLTYQWTLAYLTPGGQAVQLWQRKVNTFWKPLLWFTKGEYAGDWIGDVTRSEPNDNDKRFHHWGQSESGMADVVERFSYPGDVICDPFLGGGTTGLVALDMGRRFVGMDIDAAAVETATRRIAEVRDVA